MHRPARRQSAIAARLLGVALAWALLAPGMPLWDGLAPTPGAPGAVAADTPNMPAPQTRTVAPFVDPHLPSLSVTVVVAPDPIVVGQPATVTLTVANGAPDPATDLAISLPLPTGVTAQTPTTALPGATDPAAATGSVWTPTLGAHASTSVSATVLVGQVPAAGAVLFAPTVTARGLPLPIQMTGGALVADPARRATTQAFTPGADATLASADGAVAVRFPKGAASTGLTLRHDTVPPPGEAVPPPVAGYKRGLGVFYLTATDAGGAVVHQFANPVTVSVRYTPEQLKARGIAEGNLTLFDYDPDATVTLPNGVIQHGRWVALPTHVDPATHIATATTTHFSPNQLSDGSSPSTAFIPSTKGGEVALFTGRMTYDIPIDVPAGPNGIKPSLTLAYDSGQTDGPVGRNDLHQAGWVGKGWSLDTGSIAMDKTPNGAPLSYPLILDGRAFSVMRLDHANPQPAEGALDAWDWHTSEESFIKVEAVRLDPLANRGGSDPTTGAYQRYGWRLWTKDGTRYEFDDDLWWGWDDCPATPYMEPYRWNLARVVDTHGNTITYSYAHSTFGPGPACNGMNGTVDQASYPTRITWGANANVVGSVDHFAVAFDTGLRQFDTVHDSASDQYSGNPGAPQETKVLNDIQVQTSTDGTNWNRVRQYNFSYVGSLHSDNVNSAYTKYTLDSLDRIGADGTTALPQINFDYQGDGGTGPRLKDGFNRLWQVRNGQGGTLLITYANIANAANNDIFDNFERVATVTTMDRNVQVGQWRYDYTNPELNSLGAPYGDGDPQLYPNSARLYLNTYYTSPAPDALEVPEHSESRGHQKVTVTDANGNSTAHWFYQGDEADCRPTLTGDAIIGDAGCFIPLLFSELRAGQEYKTEMYGAGGALLSRTERTFLFGPQVDYTHNALSGVWHYYRYQDSETSTLFEGSPTGLGRTTTYVNNVTNGNLLTTKEFPDTNTGGTPYRRIERSYAALNTTGTGGSDYVMDRQTQVEMFDQTGTPVAFSQSFYDNLSFGSVGPTGALTKTSAVFDLPGADASVATYAYDAYGNRTAATTYKGPNGTGIARTTATTYDPTFHDLPVRVDNGVVNGAPTLSAWTTYDPVTRWITSATDPNGSATSAGDPNSPYVTRATYDPFGRVTGIIKPGDTANPPTLYFSYDDYAQPVVYGAAQREASGQGAWHWAFTAYDGLGRAIQTKRESQTGSVETVTDTRYDGMGNPAQVSQPRDVTVSGDFYAYTALASDPVERWTTTSYDALSRPLVVTAPDNTTTRASYSRGAVGTLTTAIDANGHETTRESDLFGRLATVKEQSGNNGNEGPYALYATTTYQYDALDRETGVTDAATKATTLAYDRLGRKVKMTDPDLGVWTYVYDAAGNLVSQTDAKNQVTGFGYDNLDRLIAESGGATATFTYDQGTNGKGHRTSAANPAATVTDAYDNRGRLTSQTEQVAGQVGSWTLATAYNDADQPTAITYPGGETVLATYDAAWRPTSACSSIGGLCYASGATYTALDQPLRTTLGNGLVEQRTYLPPMQRLQRLQVGTPASPSAVLDRSYSYDPVGDVTTIQNGLVDQLFTYDARDRLKRACTAAVPVPPTSPTCDPSNGGYDETESYDATGNLLSKGPTVYSYANSGHEHAPASVGGGAYHYDADGNTTDGGGRTYTWDARNLPLAIGIGAATGTPGNVAPARAMAPVAGVPGNVAAGRGMTPVAGVPGNAAVPRPDTSVVAEAYTYDADGQRVTRTVAGVTTLYIDGVYEVEVPSGITRRQYAFGGGVVAQRTVAGGITTVVYLHGDQLGSVSAATSSTGAVLDRAEYGPWGNVRSGSLTETTLNYTGQKRDGTGLLYYGARYYDPVLGRFLSPDSIGVEAKNPQTRNRYAYVLNNPLNHTDPSGHCSLDDGNCNDRGSGYDATSSDGSGSCDGCGFDQGGGTGIGDTFGASLSDDTLVTTGCGDSCGSTVIADPTPAPLPECCFDPVQDPVTGGAHITPTPPPTPECCFDPIAQPSAGGMLINTPTVPGMEGVAGIPGGGILTAAPGAPGGSGGDNKDPKGGTYTLRDPVTGDVMRTGRTNDLDRRQGEHQRTFPDLEFNIEHQTDDRNVQRGLAQIDHETHNPPLDRRNEIAPSNPNRDKYLDAARRFLEGGG